MLYETKVVLISLERKGKIWETKEKKKKFVAFFVA